MWEGVVCGCPCGCLLRARALGWVDGCGCACRCVPPSVSVRMGGWVWLCV